MTKSATIKFNPCFAEDVKHGVKTQTIRRSKKCEVGDNIRLYMAETKGDSLELTPLGFGTCIGIARIQVTEECPWRISDTDGVIHTHKNGKRFHELDGFENAQQFVEFFKKQYGLPFDGWLHVWKKED